MYILRLFAVLKIVKNVKKKRQKLQFRVVYIIVLVVGVNMQQITSPSVDKLPKIGYYVSHDEKKEKFSIKPSDSVHLLKSMAKEKFGNFCNILFIL